MNLRIQQLILLVISIFITGVYLYTNDQYFGIIGNIWLVGSIIVGAIQQKDTQ